MYLVELIQLNSLVKIKKRSGDYDIASTAFSALKRSQYKELRMLRVDVGGDRVLLKYVTRTARSSAQP